MSRLAIPFNLYSSVLNVLILHTNFFARISCSVTEIMSLAQETMKAREENRPKQNRLIKSNLAVTSRPKSD